MLFVVKNVYDRLHFLLFPFSPLSLMRGGNWKLSDAYDVIYDFTNNLLISKNNIPIRPCRIMSKSESLCLERRKKIILMEMN
jgi:hypothetical protein